MDGESKGVTLFKDGRSLIQKTKNKKTITKRGEGGRAAARKALAEIERELEEHVENQRAADRLGRQARLRRDAHAAADVRAILRGEYKPWATTELDPVTFSSRESVHWHLLRFFGDTPLDEITSESVDDFKAQRMREGIIYRSESAQQTRKRRPLSKAGLAEQLKVLRAILRWAEKRGYIKRSPTSEMPKDKRGAPGAANVAPTNLNRGS